MPDGEELIFGRYGREECGLPPARLDRRASWLARPLQAVVLAAALFASGWLAGVLAARQREAWQAELPARVWFAPPESLPELLSRGRAYAAALPERPGLAANLAAALTLAGERAPRRAGYFGNAANLFASLETDRLGAPEAVFETRLAAAEVYAEVGDLPRAFASLDQAAAALARLEDGGETRSRQLRLMNSRAYFLATAPDPGDGDPAQAVRLAENVLLAGDAFPAGGDAEAAFLDTLASAWRAAGEPGRARRTQAVALGLARTAGLDVYLRHYDEFAAEEGGGAASPAD